MTVDVTELMRRVREKEHENLRRQEEEIAFLREIRPYRPRVHAPRPRQPTWEDLRDLDDGDALDQYADLPTLKSAGLL